MMRRCTLVVATLVCFTGCAAPQSRAPLPPFRDPALTLQGASETIVPGKTARDALAANLGPANTVRFASGFEVWIYSMKTAAGQSSATSPAELVLLLDPSGVVQKVRIKPAYAP